MSRRLILIAALALHAVPADARAQGNTDEMLKRAIVLYEDVQLERALVVFRQVVSPSSPFEVSREQRTTAYKYIGAGLALQKMRDSAIVYFRAALERDPFTDLDPRSFLDKEQSAFAEARRRTFAVGVRPVVPDTVDPRTERIPLAVMTTHASSVRLELRAAGSATGDIVFNGDADGLVEIAWTGVRQDGRLAPTGRYELVAVGQSKLMSRTDSSRVYFDLRLDHPPLEDTLPALGLSDLLPERHPPGAAARDLSKGLLIGIISFTLPRLVAGGELSPDASMGAAAAAAGAAAGVYGFATLRRNVEIPSNIAINIQRRAARERTNAAIRERNNEKLSLSRVIVAPAAGFGVGDTR